MYLLDTNIVSLFAPRRRTEAAPVIDWLRRNDERLFLATMTIAEIEAGILKLVREGKTPRARQLAELRDALIADFGDRILPVSVEVALLVPRLADAARPLTIELADLIIAATARANGLTVLTRNLRRFTSIGVPAIDPLAVLP